MQLEGELRDLVCNKLHQFVEVMEGSFLNHTPSIIFFNPTHFSSQSFIALDTNNTKKLTLPIMNDVLMRLS